MTAHAPGLSRFADAVRPRSHRGNLIAAGVVPFTAAVTMIGVRMADEWAAGVHFVYSLLAFALVFGMLLLSAREGDRPRAYQSVLIVASLVLLFFTLGWLSEVLGAENIGSGNFTWIGTAVFATAVYLATKRNSTLATLIAAAVGGATVLSFIDWVFDPESVRTFRWILLLVIIVYIVVHLRLRDTAPRHAVQIVNAAGLATVVLAITLVDFLGILGDSFEVGGPGGVSSGAAFGWELLVLVFSLGLIAYACVDEERGPGYFGFIALLLFVTLVGAPEDEATILGWPLLFLLVGGAAVGFGLRPSQPLPPEPGTGSGAAQPAVPVTPPSGASPRVAQAPPAQPVVPEPPAPGPAEPQPPVELQPTEAPTHGVGDAPTEIQEPKSANDPKDPPA